MTCGGISSWVLVIASPSSSACWPEADRMIACTGLAKSVLVSTRFRTQAHPLFETDSTVSGLIAPFVRAQARPFSTTGPALATD